MKDYEHNLTLDRLREVLHYDPETGIWTWLVTLSSRNPAGNLACKTKHDTGYHRVSIDGHRYKAHRLAWLYMTGEWPKNQIDHKNIIRHDNRWENLREANQQQNSANMIRGTSNSGLKGVFKKKNRYLAHITVNYKSIYLGTFQSKEEAAEAYRAAAETNFGLYARTG